MIDSYIFGEVKFSLHILRIRNSQNSILSIIILTDIDGLYDSNPRTNPNAKKLDIIEKINAEIFEMAAGTGSNRGTGGMITKLQAADYATKRGVEVSVINGSNPENLYEVIDGNKIGTKFLPVK